MGSNPGYLIPNSTPIDLIESYLLVDREDLPGPYSTNPFLERTQAQLKHSLASCLWSQNQRCLITGEETSSLKPLKAPPHQ